MSNESKGKSPSWKQPQANKAAPTPTRKREWQPTSAVKPAAGRGRGRLLIAAGAGAVLLAIIVAVIILWDPPKQPRLFLAGAPNHTQLTLPHNAGGAASARSIADWTRSEKRLPTLVAEPADILKKESWNQNLDLSGDRPLVMYFAQHGGADRNGPYLWLVPAEAASPDEKQRLYVADILNWLNQFRERQKLLIFDAAQVGASWPHGALHNDFARALKTLEPKISDVPNLIVICSADEGQRSWFSEEWQQTAFGHFLLEGWKGAAGEKNSRIQAGTLFEYVQKEVRDWARANRAAVQEPFLLPAKDSGRAAGIELASVDYSKYRGGVKSIEQAPGFSFAIPPALQAAWERRDTLARGAPPPSAVAPHLWRRYQDALLRVEQLCRYGVPIEPALQQVSAIEGSLALATWQKLLSTGHALPMPRALGLAPVPVDRNIVPRLWNADDGGQKAWMELKQSSSNTTQLRLAVAELLLKALERPDRAPDTENLQRVARILGNVDLNQPPPSETHLLLLLQRELLAQRPSPALVTRALQLVQEAERLALVGAAPENEFPYSEQLVPWIADAIYETDLLRLRGEDLLFSTEADDWTKTEKLFAASQAKYRDIGSQAAQLRRAMRWRDRLAAELPYFAHWVAGLQSEFSPDQREALIQRVERLAREMHSISELLERGPQGKQLPANDRLDAIERDTLELQRTFDGFIDSLSDSALPTNWRQIDNALQVPFIPTQKRMELLQSLRRISRELAKQGSQKEGAAELPPPAVVEDAQRQGRLSWALLGERWIDDKALRGRCPSEVVKYRAADLREILVKKTTTAAELQEVGEQLGAAWRALVDEIDAVHQDAYRENLGEALRLLTRAESLARLLDSATALPAGRDPIVYLRRHRLHHFLVFQAKRSLDAGWAAVNPAQTVSYAEVCADALLRDAASLLMEEHPSASSADQSRLLAAVTPLRERLKVLPFDVLADQSTVDLTEDDARIATAFKVVPPPHQRFGYPVLRYVATGPLSLPAGLAAGRKPAATFVEGNPPPQSEAVSFTLDVDRSRAAKEPGTVQVELMHRGHRRIAKVDTALSGKPDVVWVFRPPQGPAGVAVKADEKLRAGAIGIVLDTSGSMAAGGKYDQAVQALGEMLRGLPDGTEISIAVFAGEDERPLRFIRRNAKPDYNKNRRELEKLLDELGKIKPEGRSPIAYAIRQMKNDGLPRKFTGFKSVLMLSDGDDNVVEGAGPGDIIERAFRDSDVVPQIVVFRAKPEEEANAIKQFGRVRNFDPPGQVWTGNDQAEMIGHLRDAMLPRVRFRRGENLVPQLHNERQDGLRISLPGSGADQRDNEHWTPPLDVGPYTIRTLASRPFRLDLEDGDRLWLELRQEGTSLKFAPARYTDDVTREFPRLRTAAQNVRLAVVNSRLRASQGPDDLEVLAMLERDPRNPDELSLVKPRFVWFEIRTQNPPANNPGLMPIHVENVPYYPAPTWKLTSPKWIASAPNEPNVRRAPALPIVSAWWLDRWPGDANRLPREANLSIERAFDNKNVTVDGNEVTIRSARIKEDRFLELRISTGPGKPPVLVRLDDLGETPPARLKQEHRFYIKSGQYTARFGPLTDRDEKSAFSLVFHSVQNLKNAGVPLQLDLIDAPSFNRDLIDPLPQPPKLK